MVAEQTPPADTLPEDDSAPLPAPPRRSLARPLALVAFVAVMGGGLYAARSATDAGGAGPAKPIARGGALVVETVRATSTEYAPLLVAYGELLPQESVELVSELSRRLVTIHAEEGEAVQKGQRLFSLDARDLDARLARLEVQRGLAERESARQRGLKEAGAVARGELDRHEARLAELEAELAEVRVERSKAQITAPFAGTLGVRRVSEGAWLTPSTVLCTLYDTSRLKIDAYLPEQHAADVAPGMPFSVVPSAGGPPAKGTLTVVEPALDPASRSVRVRGTVEAADTLGAGQYVRVEISLQPRPALFIPAIAVMPSATGHRVFLVEGGKTVARPVTLGVRTPEAVEIRGGLEEGDAVVTTNLLRLRPGAAVVVRGEDAPGPEQM